MAVTPPPLIDTDVSDPPNRGQEQSVFSPKMDNFLASFNPFKIAQNALASWSESVANLVEGWANSAEADATSSSASAATAVAAASSAISSPATNATSTSSITPAIGANAFTLAQAGKAFVVGQFVTVADSSSPSTKFFNGPITAFNSGTGAITVDARVVVGGAGSSWVITASAPAQSEQFNSPVQSFVALGNVTGTVNIDLRTGLVFTMTLTGNTTLTFTMPTLYASSTSVAVSLIITKAGSQTLTLPAGTDWHDGAAPTLTVGGTDEILLTKNGAADWVGSRARKAIA
jgi:hypothetical protein